MEKQRLKTEQVIVEYEGSSKLRLQSFLTYLFLLLGVMFDLMNGDEYMLSSIKLTKSIQQYEFLVGFCKVSCLVIQYGAYLYLFVIMTVRKNPEQSFMILFGCLSMYWIHALLKMVYVDGRPYFFDSGIKELVSFGCDYGKPAGFTQTTIGLLMFLYYDFVRNYSLGAAKEIFTRVFLGSCIAVVMFSQVYFGTSGIHQVFLGLLFGLASFYTLRNSEDFILKYLLWPIFYKNRFASRWSIVLILFFMVFSNFSLLYLWAFRFTDFENLDNPLFKNIKFEACKMRIESGFSTQTIREATIFNLFFGLIVGIYTNRELIFKFQGFYTDRNVLKYFLRFGIISILFSPMLFARFFKTDIFEIELLRGIILSFITGVIISWYYRPLLKLTGLLPPLIDNRESSESVSEGRKTSTSADFSTRSGSTNLQKIEEKSIEDTETEDPRNEEYIDEDEGYYQGDKPKNEL